MMEEAGFAKNQVIEDLQFDYTPMGKRHDDALNQPQHWQSQFQTITGANSRQMRKKISGRKFDMTDPLDGVVGSKKHLNYFPTINSSLDRRSINRRSKNKDEFNYIPTERNEAKIITKNTSLEEIFNPNSSFEKTVNYDKLMNLVNCYQENIKRAQRGELT